jgi:hypothetical protein
MDKLDITKINSFEQLYLRKGKTRFPIFDIDIETALCRIDVCGMLDIEEFICSNIEDHNGVQIDVEELLTEEYKTT